MSDVRLTKKDIWGPTDIYWECEGGKPTIFDKKFVELARLRDVVKDLLDGSNSLMDVNGEFKKVVYVDDVLDLFVGVLKDE